MPKLVVDASVVIKWFVPEPLSIEARQILDGYRAGALDLIAPDLLNAELANIVWKKQTFQGLGGDDARSVIDGFRDLVIAFTPTIDIIVDAYSLAITHKRTVYDSLCLALSIREACQFVTADERLANAVSSAIPTVVWLKNWL